jgi:hypothetical protein
VAASPVGHDPEAGHGREGLRLPAWFQKSRIMHGSIPYEALVTLYQHNGNTLRDR